MRLWRGPCTASACAAASAGVHPSAAALQAAEQTGFTEGEAAGRQAQTQADQIKIATAQGAVAQAKAVPAAAPSTVDQLARSRRCRKYR